MKGPLVKDRFACLIVALGFVATLHIGQFRAQSNDNWPQWRGPTGDGRSDSTGLPTTWGPDQNITWKTEWPSWSGSTPIIWGDYVFVMSPTRQAAASQEPAKNEPPAKGPGGKGGRPRRDPGGQDLL